MGKDINLRYKENLTEETAEYKSAEYGLHVVDGHGNRYRIDIDVLGNLQINSVEKKIRVVPEYSNQISIELV